MSAPKKIITTWVQPTQRRREYVALSGIHGWVGHWDPAIKRTRRCGGDLCAFCAMGWVKKLSMVCLVQDENQVEFWLELRERHRGTINQGEAGKGSFAGSCLAIKKEGEHQGAAVSIEFLGKVFVQEREIINFVEKLGSEPVLIALPSTSATERPTRSRSL